MIWRNGHLQEFGMSQKIIFLGSGIKGKPINPAGAQRRSRKKASEAFLSDEGDQSSNETNFQFGKKSGINSVQPSLFQILHVCNQRITCINISVRKFTANPLLFNRGTLCKRKVYLLRVWGNGLEKKAAEAHENPHSREVIKVQIPAKVFNAKSD